LPFKITIDYFNGFFKFTNLNFSSIVIPKIFCRWWQTLFPIYKKNSECCLEIEKRTVKRVYEGFGVGGKDD
jgi:hypothetical protein